MGRNYKKKGRCKGRNRSKGIQWYWWLVGFAVWFVMMWLSFRPNLQPLRDTVIYKVIGKMIPSGILIYFSWFSKGKPSGLGQVIMTLMAVIFWQGLIIPSQRLILLHITILVFAATGYLLYLMIHKKKNNEPLMFATMYFAIMLLDGMRDYTYADGNDMRHWVIALVLGVAAGAVAYYLVFYGHIRLKDDRISEKVCWCILAVFATFILVWSTANNLNYILDFTLPEEYEMSIKDKNIDSSRSGTYYELKVEYKGNEIELDVTQSTYFRYEIGDIFPVDLYRGFLGDPYYIAK